MFQKTIPYLFQAGLHKYHKKVNLNAKQTVPQFKTNNTDVLNIIYSELRKEFSELDYRQQCH